MSEALSSFTWPDIVRILCFGNLMTVFYYKSWGSHPLNVFIVMGSLLICVLAIGFGYSYLFPGVQPIIENVEILKPPDNLTTECNYFEGKWVYDENYPLYNASECPFVERGFSCLANGRKDKEYLKWRWKPNDCDIPNFNVSVVLEKLRGKRIVFVGDSLSRNQWESMICLLMTGVEDKNSVYEVNGHKITRRIRYLSVRFKSFNFTIEFYRSVYLVQPGSKPKSAPKRVKFTLQLDKLDDISSEWINSDILIFGTGHWWTPGKLFNTGRYFQVGGKLKLGMSVNAAYKMALATWASWAEEMVKRNRTQVFFRTFESAHWSGPTQRSCKVTKQPLSEITGIEQSPFSEIAMKLVKNITIPVTAMHVTPMTAFRSDAHVGTWSESPSVCDCSHWCLPGVPDMWNEMLFSYILSQR
ncbi:hypothetical protein RJ639_038555 [Escallonia herrerae]|uniref:Trichome birefringence-like N-terminal domain-containing protein n=1 Tax=Escallonia herrerae TaxID=1293975 RepID=A0AA88WNB5_9ASTE|nr:hypothetical protein RJ639_038555 [Escallonia herrerae]